MGSFIAKNCVSLVANLFPRDSFRLAGAEIIETASNLCLPESFGILVNGWIQAVDQGTSQLGPFPCRERQGFLQEVAGFLAHA